MATRARTPRKVSDQGNATTAAALVLSPARVTPTVAGDYGSRLTDFMVNDVDEGANKAAFGFYRSIPELHYLVSLVGAAMSQVQLKVVSKSGDSVDGNPAEVGPRHPARGLLKDFAGGSQGQAELLQRLGIHLTVTGDSILVGPGPSGPLLWPYDVFRVYSPSEVSSRSGKIYVRGPNYREEPTPPGAYAVRIWRQNPEDFWRADSPVKAAFTVLREISLLDSHIHATAVSRLKSAGILLVPEELTLPGDEMEIEGEEMDPFVRVLTEVMKIAIKDPDSAAALVPIILRGPAEYLQAMRLIEFNNEFDQQVSSLRNDALRRLALGLDAPPEILLGSGSSAGWSMWQVSESQLRLHIKPLAHLIASSLTIGWLQPALQELPLADATREGIEDVMIWPDFTQLTIRPDPGKDVQSLYDSFEVAGDTFRHALGLGEADKPTNAELEYQVYLHLLKTNPNMAAWAVQGLAEHFDIPFIDTSNALTIGTGAATGDEPVLPTDLGTPPSSEDLGEAPMIPGLRSSDKQTETPGAPPIDGDTNSNVSGPNAG